MKSITIIRKSITMIYRGQNFKFLVRYWLAIVNGHKSSPLWHLEICVVPYMCAISSYSFDAHIGRRRTDSMIEFCILAVCTLRNYTVDKYTHNKWHRTKWSVNIDHSSVQTLKLFHKSRLGSLKVTKYKTPNCQFDDMFDFMTFFVAWPVCEVDCFIRSLFTPV